MNRFDFLIAFISIVCGLALTTFLSRTVNLIVNRKNVKWYLPHSVWCFNWYSYMLLDWWLIFSWSDKEVSYWVYLFFYLKASIMVGISYILVPAKQATNMEDYFNSVRGIFFALLTLFILSDLIDSTLHGINNLKNLPVFYFIKISFASALCVASAMIKNRNAQITLALIMFAIGTVTILTFK
jgi:hypothetical protein